MLLVGKQSSWWAASLLAPPPPASVTVMQEAHCGNLWLFQFAKQTSCACTSRMFECSWYHRRIAFHQFLHLGEISHFRHNKVSWVCQWGTNLLHSCCCWSFIRPNTILFFGKYMSNVLLSILKPTYCLRSAKQTGSACDTNRTKSGCFCCPFFNAVLIWCYVNA